MTMFRVLMVHNRYKTPGGEDISTRAEVELMRAHGHDVDLWETSNEQISGTGNAALALNAIWSKSATGELRRRLAAKTYDLVHVQNSFPLLSPSILVEAAKQGLATVQHLRNYRHLCANASFFREGRVCHECAQANWPWRGILRKCYRDSRAASAVPALSVAVHRLIGTYAHHVDAYVAISDHVRSVHIAGGFPADRIRRRYSAFTPGRQVPFGERRREILCASRLSEEKGIDHLIRTWRLRPRNGTLTIAGSGPLEADLRHLAAKDPSIVFLGQLSTEDLIDRIAHSRAVINCCLWEEPFGNTPVEGFACGVPAIVSDGGGLAESVTHEENGLIVAPGNMNQLDLAIARLLDDDSLATDLGNRALITHREQFHPDIIAAQTEQIYYQALRHRQDKPLQKEGRQKCQDTAL
ncbi:glycosyltransferase family 4 protein [Labrenzia sp. PHM005]|nr:glycosyltransferase family 4 protein [Labrenzia sp. PHM005]